MVHHRGHEFPLDLAADLAAEFAGLWFDDRVMRNPLNGADEPIQRDQDLGDAPQKIIH